ncbi:hypothetical protein [Clostridium perfringens]|uniref:Phage protein n=1 Tax=Clostridium perfringens TaxID=1502 RepID=A0ABD4PSA0_CLOPF|nr:hypothetical protein [Clostridium perfringens]MBO3417924.1 hypothetical protein [Clostridium perfringens]NGT56783.1 hypothetical protein [Clostridium perfringens]NGT85707.1 hypothetical protein [Clostridium perfringens]UBK35704.1 hypothetical protein KLF25_04735 [Clostridium perfringens]
MNVDITVLVGIVGTLTGIYCGLWKAKKDQEKEAKEDASKDTTVTVTLEYISKGVDEIRIDNKVRDKQYLNFAERLVAVEKSAASAHHRLDGIEKKEGI